jgi:hypothetical protein
MHGALRHYDLPGLAELAGPGKVKSIRPAKVSGDRTQWQSSLV